MTFPPVPTRVRFEKNAPTVEWLYSDGEAFTESFFRQTQLRFRRLPENSHANHPRTSVHDLAGVSADSAPAGLIFHISRCGSTLLAQMLAQLDRNIVVSEPQVADDILRVSRAIPSITDEDRIAWLRGAFAAYARARGAGKRLFVKFDSWLIFELPLIERAFPGVPKIFVYRDPVEVLVSLGRSPSFTLVRGTVTPDQLGLTSEETLALSFEDYAASVLGAFFRTALAHHSSLVSVAYPDIAPFVVSHFPGCGWLQEERETLQRPIPQHAKDPTQSFVPDAEEKRRAASPAVIEAVARRTAPAYADFCNRVKSARRS